MKEYLGEAGCAKVEPGGHEFHVALLERVVDDLLILLHHDGARRVD